MRRKLVTLAAAAIVGLGVATVPATAAGAATVPPTAAGAATVPPTAAGAATVPPTAAGAADDNATVCVATAKILTDGLSDFVGDLNAVGTAVQQGNLTQADQKAKVAGQRLSAVGTELRTEAGKADNTELKSTLTGIAGQFESMGASLTSVQSLGSFDSSKLDAVETSLGKVCGTNAPSPVSPVPSSPART